MAIKIPTTWPKNTWVENPPLAHLQTVSEPVAGVPAVPPTRWKVATWSTTREISASALPGQVRARTGLSIGTGRALVKRDPDDFPWKKRLVYELTGQNAELRIAPENLTEIPTGQFQVAEISGNLTDLGVEVDLDERTIEGRDKAANVRGWEYISRYQTENTWVDPAWIIEQLARQMGYGVGTQPGQPLPDGDIYEPILDVPLQGSLTPAYPAEAAYLDFNGVSWTSLDAGRGNIIAVTGDDSDGSGDTRVRYSLFSPLQASLTLTFDLDGDLQFQWVAIDTEAVMSFSLAPVTPGPPSETTLYQLDVFSWGDNDVYNGSSTAQFTLPVSEDRPCGFQVQFEFNNGVPSSTVWTSSRARVRRGEGQPWSAWVTRAMANTVSAVTNENSEAGLFEPEFLLSSGHKLSRLSAVNTAQGNDPDSLWTATSGPEGKIYLEPLLGKIISPWLSPELSVWAAMQEVVNAWQGALITDVYGDLHLLNRYSLTGVGTGEERAIDVGLRFEDIPWQMNHADQADRLVLRYRPASLVLATQNSQVHNLWEADSVIIVWPGTNEVFFSTEYVYPLYFSPFYQKGEIPSSQYGNEWDAYRYNNGTGAHITPDQADFSIRQVTTSTYAVTILNRTNEPFHLVDSTGAPFLKIRTSGFVTQTEEARIELGVSSSAARNPIEIDANNYIQNVDDAQAIAEFIWGRVNQRSWRASTINAVPDYRLDLGDVVELVHERTAMRSNALVTKVHLEGEPGQLRQHLDLVLIPPTWEDFDEAWAAYLPNPPGSWTEFDALWAPYTWADFDRTPTATTATQIEEAM